MNEPEGTASPITIRELTYDDPSLPAVWMRLLDQSDRRPVTQSLEWHRTWWQTHARGRLILLAAERDGDTVAIAPLFHDQGMIFFVGVGEADCHDMLGDAHDPTVLAALLATARSMTPDFLGFRLHFITECSRTHAALPTAASRIGLEAVEERTMASVIVDLAGDPESARRSVSRSMRKTEDALRRSGDFAVTRIDTAAAALPLLPVLYEMHISRWQERDVESIFLDPARRAFLERWVTVSAAHGWLRLIQLLWNGRTIGIDLNWHYRGTQYSGPWAFDLALRKNSPGQVLLRQALLMALDAGMHTYDLGLGDEPYKFRLPCRVISCHTVGLYPRS